MLLECVTEAVRLLAHVPRLEARRSRLGALRYGLTPWPKKQPPRITVVHLGGNMFRAMAPLNRMHDTPPIR